MKKYLLIGAASFAFVSAAHAGTTSGTLNDADGSSTVLTYTSSTSDDTGEDYGSPITARFTLKGKVNKTCAIQAVDSTQPSGLMGPLTSVPSGSTPAMKIRLPTSSS